MMLPGHLHTRFKAVHHYQADTLTVESTTPQFGQADGEDLGKRSFHFKFSVRHQKFIF
jgi:diacylglycerol kinase family enzyme